VWRSLTCLGVTVLTIDEETFLRGLLETDNARLLREIHTALDSRAAWLPVALRKAQLSGVIWGQETAPRVCPAPGTETLLELQRWAARQLAEKLISLCLLMKASAESEETHAVDFTKTPSRKEMQEGILHLKEEYARPTAIHLEEHVAQALENEILLLGHSPIDVP